MKTVRTITRVPDPRNRRKFHETCLALAHYRDDGTHVGTTFIAARIAPYTIYHPPENEPLRPGEEEELLGKPGEFGL
jgi:hypothetical protein